ncbi:MAG: hypothetical protein COB25_000235 [Oceanospirillales bacterium]|nr:hypothetical protein [Oceanospirillales bacterium]
MSSVLVVVTILTVEADAQATDEIVADHSVGDETNREQLAFWFKEIFILIGFVYTYTHTA